MFQKLEAPKQPRHTTKAVVPCSQWKLSSAFLLALPLGVSPSGTKRLGQQCGGKAAGSAQKQPAQLFVWK